MLWAPTELTDWPLAPELRNYSSRNYSLLRCIWLLIH